MEAAGGVPAPNEVGGLGRGRGGKDFYLTVAIDYPNGEPHVGHAYEKVAADAVVRYQRLRGRRAYYLMGNDEHSQNVLRAARERGLEPEEFCARMAEVFRGAWDALGVAYDHFMRTGDPRHAAAVRTVVQRLHDRGHVYRGTYRGWYCVSCEAFKTDRDLVDGLCPVHRRPVERVEEENWFFRLSAFRDALLRHLEARPEFVQPEGPRHEMRNVLREGLEDVSISRARSGWGVPLPWDPAHVVYVWFDALITYLSGAGFGWDEERFSRLWPADVHLIGKDIARFHCIIWPAMLLGAGLELPGSVFVHGFLNVRGEKLSKTTGNVVDPVQFLRAYGRDATRWYLVAETPFGSDGNFAPESFVKRYNSDLANDLGNLLHRTLAMIERFAEGRVPEPPPGSDDGFAAAAAEAVEAFGRAMDALRLHEAASALLQLCAKANRYVDQQSPWDLARRGDGARLRAVLYNLAETLRILAVALGPFLVDAPAEMARQLGLPPEAVRAASWRDLRWGGLPPGTRVRRGEPLFARLDAEAVMADTASFGSGAAAGDGGTMAAPATRGPVGPAPAGGEAGEALPVAPPAAGPDPGRAPATAAEGLLTIDAFRQVDLRVARVLSAARVEGTARLLRLELDVGAERRQVVAGIAEHYAPEELVGRQVVLVANLRPAAIRGVRSEGMLLAATAGRELRLVTPDGPVPPGSPVR
jgi:methionyl-tRNA synthetase